jgi:hypothetical protein
MPFPVLLSFKIISCVKSVLYHIYIYIYSLTRFNSKTVGGRCLPVVRRRCLLLDCLVLETLCDLKQGKCSTATSGRNWSMTSQLSVIHVLIQGLFALVNNSLLHRRKLGSAYLVRNKLWFMWKELHETNIKHHPGVWYGLRRSTKCLCQDNQCRTEIWTRNFLNTMQECRELHRDVQNVIQRCSPSI